MSVKITPVILISAGNRVFTKKTNIETIDMPSTEWETPQDFFDKLNSEFGFNLDVCAQSDNTKLTNFYSEESLSKPWKGRCWMNPPYDKNIGEWVKKAYESSLQGATVVCLLQGRSCDTKWFHNFVMKASEIRFIKDRLHFGLNGKFSRANISSMIVVFRPNHIGYPSVCSIDNKGNLLRNYARLQGGV